MIQLQPVLCVHIIYLFIYSSNNFINFNKHYFLNIYIFNWIWTHTGKLSFILFEKSTMYKKEIYLNIFLFLEVEHHEIG